jgi:hypothetical protein
VSHSRSPPWPGPHADWHSERRAGGVGRRRFVALPARLRTLLDGMRSRPTIATWIRQALHVGRSQSNRAWPVRARIGSQGSWQSRLSALGRCFVRSLLPLRVDELRLQRRLRGHDSPRSSVIAQFSTPRSAPWRGTMAEGHDGGGARWRRGTMARGTMAVDNA